MKLSIYDTISIWDLEPPSDAVPLVTYFTAHLSSHQTAKVTTLTYSNSIEETQFLTTTKREIKAFEDLIEEKENIAKRPDLKTAVSSDTTQPIVLIDTREFRSGGFSKRCSEFGLLLVAVQHQFDWSKALSTWHQSENPSHTYLQ